MGFKLTSLVPLTCLSLGLSHFTPSLAQSGVPPLAQSSIAAQHLVQVAAERLQIRSEPHETAPIIGQVIRGEMLTVLEVKSDWIGVAIDSSTPQRGWIRQTWLSSEGQFALQSLMGPGPVSLARRPPAWNRQPLTSHAPSRSPVW